MNLKEYNRILKLAGQTPVNEDKKYRERKKRQRQRERWDNWVDPQKLSWYKLKDLNEIILNIKEMGMDIDSWYEKGKDFWILIEKSTDEKLVIVTINKETGAVKAVRGKHNHRISEKLEPVVDKLLKTLNVTKHEQDDYLSSRDYVPNWIEEDPTCSAKSMKKATY